MNCIKPVSGNKYTLNEFSKKKKCYIINNNLSCDIDHYISKLLENEIYFAKSVEAIINEMKIQIDYDIVDIYKALQGEGGFISEER